MEVRQVSHTASMPSSVPAEPDPAYLPNVGDVYRVSPHLLGSRASMTASRAGSEAADGDEMVPVVVLAVPALRTARIQVVTRVPSRIAAGVPHGAAPQLGLLRPGVWTNVLSVDKSLWTPRDTSWRGPLERIVFAEVRERFE
jgi:hypothetical protein